MESTSKVGFCLAMVMLTVVSIWTTYVSLTESILPGPTVPLPIGENGWDCSVFAMALSVAIGLMLFSLKLAIIDEHKRLNAVGIAGLAILAFVSITFNMDVLYRTYDRSFFLRHSTAKMKSTYETYLGEVRGALIDKKKALDIELARQEGELEAETRGLRQKPEGYGPEAKKEDYRLTLLQKTTAVELKVFDEALAKQGVVDDLLTEARPATLDDIQALQDEIRVQAKDLGAAAGLPLPPPVTLESPLFAVIERLLDFKTVGRMEIFFLFLAVIIDLGDIVGYAMVPSGTRKKKPAYLGPVGDGPGPEIIRERLPAPRKTRWLPRRAAVSTIRFSGTPIRTKGACMGVGEGLRGGRCVFGGNNEGSSANRGIAPRHGKVQARARYKC